MRRLTLILILCSCCTLLTAQSDAYKRLATYAAHIGYFNQLCPQEKVYLHLDNTAYFQGETIWFAANVVNASTLDEAASKVLYVELLSPTGVVLKQQKLKVVDGRCHGSFALIDTSVREAVEKRGAVNLPSGYYQIRAYTRAMLNFDEAGIYSRVVPVYAMPRTDGDYSSPTVLDYPLSDDIRPEMQRLEKLNVTFYPEGGHLISGVPCRIAFKATDENGVGVEIESVVEKDGTAKSISSQHKGMGYFTHVPDLHAETVKVICQGHEYQFRLPEPEPSGCTLMADNSHADHLTVHLSLVNIPDSVLGYTLLSAGRLMAFDTITANVSERNITIDKRPMPAGVSQLTVFGSSGDIYAQRMFFVHNDIPYHALDVHFSKSAYRPFEQIQMRISSPDHQPSLPFSVAVRDAMEHGTSYSDDVRTSLLLSSELKGLIEEPAWYFSQAPEAERTAALDLLMMVQGWTRHDWRQMAGVEPFKVKHYTEGQLVLDGWAFSRIKEEPLSDVEVNVNLYSPDRKLCQKSVVHTDSLGYWSVGLEDFEGRWDLLYTTRQPDDERGKRATRVRLGRSCKPAVNAYQPIETYLPDHTQANALLPVWNADELAFMMPEDVIMLDEVEVQAERLYVDYGTFHAYDVESECEDIFDEGDYTPDLIDFYRKHNIGIGLDGKNWAGAAQVITCKMDSTGRPVADHANRNMSRERGLEFIRSILIYDPVHNPRVLPCVRECLSSFSPPHIDPQKTKFVVIEITYGSFESHKRKTDNSRATTFKGYDSPVEFYAPTYPDGPVQGDKDYRRTIYWNPEMTTDADGVASVSFYNNGYSRSLTVSAEGLTADGVPILNQ